MQQMKNKEHYLYGTWRNMRQRINDKNHKDYPYYGGKGIKILVKTILLRTVGGQIRRPKA